MLFPYDAENYFGNQFFECLKEYQSVIQINIISATPGIGTHDKILQLIQTRNTGITIKEISRRINRPISMIQICLKDLIADKAIFSRKNRAGVGLIYYPK